MQQMENDSLIVLFQPQSYGKTPQAAEKSPLHGWLDLGMRMSVILMSWVLQPLLLLIHNVYSWELYLSISISWCRYFILLCRWSNMQNMWSRSYRSWYVRHMQYLKCRRSMVKQRMIAGFVAHYKLNALKYAKYQASCDYEHSFNLSATDFENRHFVFSNIGMSKVKSNNSEFQPNACFGRVSPCLLCSL